MNKINQFLEETYPPGTYFAVLQAFIKKKRCKLSDAGLLHLWRSLYALGEWLGNPAIDAITRRQLRDYDHSLWQRYSRGTIIPIVGDIKQFFDWCKKKGCTDKNVGKKLRRPRPKSSHRSAEETAVYAVLDFLKQIISHRIYRDVFRNLVIDPAENWTKPERYAARDLFAVAFLYETGARAGELCELGSTRMNKIVKQPARAYTITVVGKTYDRDYHFTHTTAEIWKVWQAVRPESDYDRFAIIGWKNGAAPLPLLTNGLSQMLARRCRQAGQSDVFRSHALRHAKVNRSRRLVGVEVASVLVDHSNIETTLGYAHVDDSELDDAVVITGLKPIL